MEKVTLLIIGCILFGNINAQAAGIETPTTLDSAISQAASSLEDQFETNYGGRVEEVRLILPNMSLSDWSYQDAQTKEGFVIGSKDDPKLREHLNNIQMSLEVKDEFAPFEAKIAKAIQGTDTDKNDLLQRLIALKVLKDVSDPENNWNEYQQTNIQNSQLQHYALLTRNIQFANLISIELAHRLNNTYKNPADFLRNFVEAFVAISPERLNAIAEEASNIANNQLQAGFMVTVSPERAEIWNAGNTHYRVQENGKTTMMKDQEPVYGAGYIGGYYYPIKIETLVGNAEQTTISKTIN